jgi:hypothetical protein
MISNPSGTEQCVHLLYAFAPAQTEMGVDNKQLLIADEYFERDRPAWLTHRGQETGFSCAGRKCRYDCISVEFLRHG